MNARAGFLDLDGWVAPFPGWTLVEVAGRDRERFLSSQVTSDLTTLGEGESQPSALLDRTGRLQAFFFIRKRSDVVDLLIPEPVADHCVEKLEDHVIAEDVAIERRDVGPMRLALGPAAVVIADLRSAHVFFPVAGWGSRGFVIWSQQEFGLPDVSSTELSTRSVLGGPPTWGLEIQPGQLINETSLLDSAVSFDKGCYLGQETVAKVAAHRGAVRASVLLELEDSETDITGLVGTKFRAGDRANAGEVLSAARWNGAGWLQVSLHRELRVIGRKLRCVFTDDRAIDTAIHSMPLLPPPSREEMADRLTVAASAAYAEDRDDRALELLDRAIAICPTWADAHESKGVILGRLGRLSEAIEQMRRLLEVEPSSVMAHSNLSLFHNLLGDIEKAEEHLALASRVSFGGRPVLDSERSDQQERERRDADHRRREEMFRQVLEIDPDDALANFGMGELSAERGRFAQAIDHFELAIASDPAHSAAILALGGVLEGLNETDRARATYEQGVEIAAKKGDLTAARKMQERLNALSR